MCVGVEYKISKKRLNFVDSIIAVAVVMVGPMVLEPNLTSLRAKYDEEIIKRIVLHYVVIGTLKQF